MANVALINLECWAIPYQTNGDLAHTQVGIKILKLYICDLCLN